MSLKKDNISQLVHYSVDKIVWGGGGGSLIVNCKLNSDCCHGNPEHLEEPVLNRLHYKGISGMTHKFSIYRHIYI